MAKSQPTKKDKEIRLKFSSAFYLLLEKNAADYGLKTKDYIFYLLMEDIKHTTSTCNQEKKYTLEDFKKIRFSGDKNLSKNIDQILYNQ